MTDTINLRLQAQLTGVLAKHIESFFKEGTRLSIIARTPGNDEADVMVTSDSIDGLMALLERSKAREAT